MSFPIFGDEANLPRRLAGLALLGTQVYPDARLGARARYEHEGTNGDVYLYNPGSKDIPEDLRSEEVIAFFQQACQDISRTAQQGTYLDLRVYSSQYLHIPPEAPEPFCLHASFSYRQVAGPGNSYTGPRMSHLALRIDRGLIDKVRFTYNAERKAEGLDDFMRFLQEWVAAIRAQPTS